MSFESFMRFIDQTAHLFDTVALVGSGEPMLHARFCDFVRYAAAKRMRVECCTSGMAPQDSEQVAASGLTAVYIDVDGVTQEQHARYRAGGDLTRTLEFIRQLRIARDKADRAYPRIYMDTIISRYNEADYRTLIVRARSQGVDGIRFRGIIDDMRGTTQWYPRTRRFRHHRRAAGARFDCSARHTPVGILSWDGAVQLCLMNPNRVQGCVKMHAFGRDDLAQYFSSADFVRVGERAGEYGFCKQCYTRLFETYYEMRYFAPEPGCAAACHGVAAGV
jgi:MoaA/NifB/PqqE/SkfB family radical SAM enzyme